MALTPTQTRIVELLKKGPKTVHELADALYGFHGPSELGAVYVHICYARKRGAQINDSFMVPEARRYTDSQERAYKLYALGPPESPEAYESGP